MWTTLIGSFEFNIIWNIAIGFQSSITQYHEGMLKKNSASYVKHLLNVSRFYIISLVIWF